ncbi:MAG: Asp-tRNA(Asn)/Glu-tRNA(Gln) amidotransferase subunit GatC [Candidatus Paceibacterota bacterium]|jgi:aspartyl/glutamyl-tRNA(Asn/Gln) amidotransferase C subunit
MILDDAALDHLFALARIEREDDPVRRQKLLQDLSAILDHFQELRGVDTDHIQPLSGGTFLTNVTRSDEEAVRDVVCVAEERDAALRQFPEAEHGYLKVPPVFE